MLLVYMVNDVVGFKTSTLLISLAALVVMVTAIIVLINTLTPKREKIYVEVVGFKSYGYDSLEYLAKIYVGRELVRKIYMIIPVNSTVQKPLRIHIPMVSESTIKSLRIVFTPPPNTVLDDLAWVVTTINTPVKYYKDEASVVWECENMGIYGKGTISLEFVPRYLKTGYFKEVVTTFTMTLEYKGQQYTVVHNVVIN